MSRQGREAAPEALAIDPPGEGSTPKIGRVIVKRLGDELSDRIALVVDGLDGRVRHIEVDGDTAADIRIGRLPRRAPSRAVARPTAP